MATLGALGAAACQWLIQPLVGGTVPFFLVPVILFFGLRFGRAAALIVIAIGLANLALLISPLGGGVTFTKAGATVLGLYLVLAIGSSTLGRRMRLVSLRAVDTEMRLLLAEENTGMGVFALDYIAQTAYLSAGVCMLVSKPGCRWPDTSCRMVLIANSERRFGATGGTASGLNPARCLARANLHEPQQSYRRFRRAASRHHVRSPPGGLFDRCGSPASRKHQDAVMIPPSPLSTIAVSVLALARRTPGRRDGCSEQCITDWRSLGPETFRRLIARRTAL